MANLDAAVVEIEVHDRVGKPVGVLHGKPVPPNGSDHVGRRQLALESLADRHRDCDVDVGVVLDEISITDNP